MFDKRIQNLRKQLKKEKLDGVFISSVFNISYLTGYSNFSKDEREAYLFLGDNFQYLITDGRYSEAVKKEVSHLTLFERGHKKSTEELLKKHKKDIKSLGIEEDDLTVSEYKIIKKHFKNIKHFSIGNLRSIKTDQELSKIEKACKVGDLAFSYILKKIRIGISEKEIAQDLEKFIKEQRAEFSFPAIVAFGKNSSVPHHQTGVTKLKDGDTVLLDLGAKVEDYCSDMTRTLFFGKPSKKQIEIYKTVLESQKRAVDFINKQIKSGKKAKASKVDKVARDYIQSKGFPDTPHFLGHGIGLEIHEHPSLSPKSRDYLQEGIVFSIEPGIYVPDFGGVRIEDLYTIEKGKLKQITNSAKTLFSI